MEEGKHWFPQASFSSESENVSAGEFYYWEPSRKTNRIFEEKETYCKRTKSSLPFHSASLAGQMITHLNDPKVKLIATPSKTYPYPTQGKARFNIGSEP